MLIILIWLIAPTIQIILSWARITRHVNFSIALIMALSLILGIALTIVSIYLFPSASGPDEDDHSTPAMASLFPFVFLFQVAAAFTISLISAILFYLNKKNRKRLPPAFH